jgi:hypothetical protein
METGEVHKAYLKNVQHHDRGLPADLSAPPEVRAWRSRALVVAAISGLLSLVFLFTGNLDHFLRAWVVGYMVIFGLTAGGIAVLMLQYVTGGKWGLLLRSPLEAMTRCLPLIVVLWLPIGFGVKRLYIWAAVTNVGQALHDHLITGAEAHAIAWKRPMLNIEWFWIRAFIYFAIWGIYTWRLNVMATQREADPLANTQARVKYWQTRFENLSGFGIVVYAILLQAAAIDWVQSMDPTWYSTVWGFVYLVAEGFSVLALGIMTAIYLAKYEPYKRILRITEQQDLGKLVLAFVMLNIYLNFGEFLIIWSGNSPEEIPWYLNRFGGGWAVVITLDFIFHWVIPFTLLLSRDFKRSRAKMIGLCWWILFARLFDTWWQVEPGFPDARRNLHFSLGMMAYITVPVFLMAIYLAYFYHQLTVKPVFVRNDPHVPEILEAEHVHA